MVASLPEVGRQLPTQTGQLIHGGNSTVPRCFAGVVDIGDVDAEQSVDPGELDHPALLRPSREEEIR